MFKKVFTTKNIAGMAVFAALSYAVSFLEFPIFPAAGFLKLDFSFVFVLLGGFMYGPVAGVIISGIKELLRLLSSSTGGVGELANFIVCVAFIIVPTVIYYYRKGIITVLLTLIVGIILQAAAALICNRYIMFPMYMGEGAEAAFNSLFKYVLFFNLIKGAVISVIVLILYKRISYLFKRINLQSVPADDIIDTQKQRGEEKFSSSEEETFAIAKEFAKSLKNGDVVLLDGDLGAGKTAFVKGVAAAFGLEGVTSPTYAYLNVYGDKLYHYDFYRLSSGEDALRLGLNDYFNKDNICLIEWGENVKDILPENCKRVKIDKISDTQRKITLYY
ncbi:MAG: tRNA (adenosine(37)-N6)-threonylcarbamoyltransferase complex ATPase subunit type 1 TsaE [Clostridia bacterium]|nr:tRNA (adenosine(37)-N6)-threonylcarbamoyltransferase complex ATPase subunit type 1 TsaE [Clostridia bacterium]